MTERVYIESKPVVDFDDKHSVASLLASASGQELLNFRTRTGRVARLVFLGNDAGGGDEQVTFHLEVNRNRLYPFDAFQYAVGPVYDASAALGSFYELPQNAEVRITADNSDGTNAYRVTVRVRIEYYDP